MSETQLFDIRGHRIAIQAHNTDRAGTPLVFIHGITASVNFWERTLPPEIRDERPWYSLSLPGHFPAKFPEHFAPIEIHAEMFADLMAETLIQAGLKQPAAIVGWSTGGFSALNLAIRYPDLVRQVMSICGFGRGQWRGLVGWMSRLASGGRGGRALFRTLMQKTWNSDELFRWSIRKGVANHAAYLAYPLLQEQLAAMQADARQNDPAVMSWLFRRVPRFDLTEQLSRIVAPTWIVGGERDPFIPVKETRWLAESIPGARLIVWPGCGHMFFAEETESWHAALREFVESLS